MSPPAPPGGGGVLFFVLLFCSCCLLPLLFRWCPLALLLFVFLEGVVDSRDDGEEGSLEGIGLCK